ncbi:PAAR domain-containing protein [Massilia sp. TS11]|uniref:PAAR domain-containing protein n=1 Tax=Massilia sp. TS11 TaxID=2908003 RepID=UPI001EDB06B2|nr:PAAR domain-containing protein [Massilia sp. TS11]MCG2582746.1 PAAR domain-containing protein [Massilia sp. TS11]
MKRHTITLGAQTTVGGKVITASSAISISGARVALEGDSVFCPACKSEGKIKCDGPRLREFFNDRNVSLDGDLCACACSIPPRLIAMQTTRWQVLEGNEAEVWAHELDAAKSVHGSDTGGKHHHGKTAFVSEHSDRPLEGANYATASNGPKVVGVTDDAGQGRL